MGIAVRGKQSCRVSGLRRGGRAVEMLVLYGQEEGGSNLLRAFPKSKQPRSLTRHISLTLQPSQPCSQQYGLGRYCSSQLVYPACTTQSPQTFVGKTFPGHKHLRPAYSVNQGRWVYERVFASMQCEDGPSSEVLLSYSTVKRLRYPRLGMKPW